MDIRKKTVIIICITLLLLILALYASSEIIVMGGFSRVESQSALKDTNRVLVALGNDINTLDAVAYDWASRDDTRLLVLANKSGGQWSRLDPDSFERLGFNEVLVSDPKGGFITGQGYNLKSRILVAPPAQLRTLFSAYPDTASLSRSDTGTMGIVDLPEGPMMIAIRPIFVNASSRDRAGYILIGRYLDSDEVSRLSSLTQLPLELQAYDNPAMPADYVRAISTFTSPPAPFVQREGKESLVLDAPTDIEPVDNSLLGTYSLIRDIYGVPALVLKVSISRDISAQGRSTTLYFVILLIAAGLIFGLATLLLLEKTVLSRLATLSRRVNDIGRKRDFSARVDISGEDEIGGLADNVNGMLGDLEKSQAVLQNRLVESEENYRLFFNSITDPVCVCRMNPDNTPGKIVEVNAAACEVLGYLRTEFLGMDLSTVLLGKGEGGEDLPVEVLHSFGHVIYAGICRTKGGITIPVEINARVFDQFGRPAFVAIMRDITEREEVEHLKMNAFRQIESNLQQFAILNDHIRNPLQGMIGLADMMDDPLAKKIIQYGKMIDEIVNKIDRGYIESEKIHEFLRKYYDIGKK